MGKNKSHQFILGFALETNDEIKNAISKLKSKNLDAIVMNSLKNSGAGFSGDTNKVSYITRDEIIIPFELKLKDQVAIDIFTEILKNV
jgi:phosphopantothenoylcysteine decarboxylase/phosphopantothenate--cysteine ligase